MHRPTRAARIAALLWLFLAACDTDVRTDRPVVERDTVRDTVYVAQAGLDSTSFLDPTALPITLPVLDAFLQDSTFVAEVRDSLGLSDEQLTELRRIAREESRRLGTDSAAADTTMVAGTTAARQRALERISAVIGAQKTYHLARLIRTGWEAGVPGDLAMTSTPNAVPTDTRIVINAPSFRMDLFENGQLVRSFPIAAGYPEFPLPSGMRQASEIIFNPSWTPPDESWVESSDKVKPGQRVAPGSSLNPLGIMKIPIGGPSLIHGGKSQAQVGTFGSHGCAGLTDEQAREFVRLLAEVTGTTLTEKQIAEYGRNRKESHTVRLARPIPVELRYETMVVQNGALHIYPDIYDRGTSSEQAVTGLLQAHGLTLEQLTPQERTKLNEAMSRMGVGDRSRADSVAGARADTSTRGRASVTKTLKGPKEIVVQIAALKGKGYPAPARTATRRPAGARSDTTA